MILLRPRFPGALKSALVDKMEFVTASTQPVIPTFRVLNSDGVIENESQELLNVEDEQILTWYKNMLTGTSLCMHAGVDN